MRTYLDCVPCFVRQAIDAARMVTDDPRIHERVLRETLKLAAAMSFDQCPPAMGARIHRVLRAETKNADPYLTAKQTANAHALEMMPALRQRVLAADDSLAVAARLAIAGNIIDLGCKSAISADEIEAAIDRALKEPLGANSVAEFREAIDAAGEILYLADNAGEIVLDRLLVEQLPREKTTLAVRGRPVINDALRADAEYAGLTELVPVIDNGDDVPGTNPATCSPDFRQRFESADLIIAKGQGNYETLSEEPRNIWFLLQAKCPVIATHIGCEIGSALLLRSPHSKSKQSPAAPALTSEGVEE